MRDDRKRLLSEASLAREIREARTAACEAIVDRCEAGLWSPPVALMRLLIELEDADQVERFVRGRLALDGSASPRSHPRSHPRADPRPERSALDELARLLDGQRAGVARVAAMLRSGVDTPPENATVDEGVAFCRKLFDWSVEQSEEASVALYSLGDPGLLAAATHEIVGWLEASGLLGPSLDVLDIGCGIGRLEVALSPRIRSIVGLDISEGMLKRAAFRCQDLANVRLHRTNGTDLSVFADASFDLVLSVDAFPYLVQTGDSLVETITAECARVLRPRGSLVVLNFSYRGDDEHDRSDVARLAQVHGLKTVTLGDRPFRVWDGLAFVSMKPA